MTHDPNSPHDTNAPNEQSRDRNKSTQLDEKRIQEQSAQNEWLQQIAQRLDESSESIDYPTQLKLQKAREAALNHGARQSSRKRYWWQMVVPGVAVAATVTALTINAFLVQPSTDSTTDSLFLQDIELLAAEEELELFNDLEFYEWLESDAANELES